MKKSALLSLALFLGLCLAGGSQTQTASLNDTQRLTHLLNRAGFGPRPGDMERVGQMGASKYVEQQLHPELIDDSATDIRLEPFDTLCMSVGEIFEHFADPQMILQQLNNGAGGAGDQAAQRQKVQAYMQQMGISSPQRLAQELAAQKLVRAVSSERQLQEVLTDFWYNHFNIFIGKGVDRFVTTDFEMNAIRPHVLGKFKDLLMATAKSPAMMFYLDNVLSTSARGGNPQRPGTGGINENYARELMELHTLGVDGGPQLVQAIERMGQPLYRYEAPTGFPDRASYWMNNGVLVERINFGIALTSNRIPGTRVDLKGYKDPESAALILGSPEFQKK